MADAATTRREARRRRILENSHNRLQLISGKIDDDLYKDSPKRSPIPDQNVVLPVITEVNTINTCFLNNGGINSEEPLGFICENESNEREVTNDLAALISSPELTPAQNSSVIDRFVNNKYDIVFLSLLIQLLHQFSIFTVQRSYFFLPLILYCVTKLIFIPKQSNSNITYALLLLNGISAEKVKIILYVMQMIMLISSDVGVFLFTTICTQSLFTIVKDNLIT